VQKVIRPIAALGAVLFGAVGLSACGGIPGNAVVNVAGTPITRSAFNHWMEVAAASTRVTPTSKIIVPVPPRYTACIKHLEETSAKPLKGSKAPSHAELLSQCEQQYKSLQSEVLGFLISSSWVLGEGNALNVKLSDNEVHKQFTKIKVEQFPKASEFEKFLSSSGQTVSDLLLRVKLNMLSQKIQKKVAENKKKVTHAEIVSFYKENSSRYGTPEKRNVRIILTKGEAEAKSAKKEIESGKSFASVAKAHSIDPASKANGGLIQGVVKGEEEKALSEAIFAAKLHQLGGPVKTPFGYYLYVVETITAGTATPLSQVESAIKQQLIATRQQKALSEFVKRFKKTWTAKTECRPGYVVPDCKEYKAPKGSATGLP
jgi:foldase protein PrsA